MGFRGAIPPLLVPRRPSFGKERQTGRRGVGEAQLFTFRSASLWLGCDGGLAGWADRGVEIRALCSRVCASRHHGGQRQKPHDTPGRLIHARRRVLFSPEKRSSGSSLPTSGGPGRGDAV